MFSEAFNAELWRLLVLPIVSMNLVEKIMESIRTTSNFHEFCLVFWTLTEPSEAIVPEIMEIMETFSFTNSSMSFATKFM